MNAKDFLKDLRININRFVTIETDVDEKGTAIMLYDLLESYHEAKLKENMLEETICPCGKVNNTKDCDCPIDDFFDKDDLK